MDKLFEALKKTITDSLLSCEREARTQINRPTDPLDAASSAYHLLQAPPHWGSVVIRVPEPARNMVSQAIEYMQGAYEMVQEVERECQKIRLRARLGKINPSPGTKPLIEELESSMQGLRQIAVNDMNSRFGGSDSDAYGILSRAMDPPRALEEVITSHSTIEERNGWKTHTITLTGHELCILSSYLALASRAYTHLQQSGEGVLALSVLRAKNLAAAFLVIKEMLRFPESYPTIKSIVDPELPVQVAGDPLKDAVAFFSYQASLGIPVNLYITGLTLEQARRLSESASTPSTQNPRRIHLSAEYNGVQRCVEISDGKVTAHARGFSAHAKASDIEFRGRLHEYLDTQFNALTTYPDDESNTAWERQNPRSGQGSAQASGPSALELLTLLHQPRREGASFAYPAVTNPSADLGISPTITLFLEDVPPGVVAGFQLPPAAIELLNSQTMLSKQYDRLNFPAVKASTLELEHENLFKAGMRATGRERDADRLLTQEKYAALRRLFQG